MLLPTAGRQILTGVEIVSADQAAVRAAFLAVAKRLYCVTVEGEEAPARLDSSEEEELSDWLAVREVRDLVPTTTGGAILVWYWANQHDPQAIVRALILQILTEELDRAGATPATLRAPGLSEGVLESMSTPLTVDLFADEAAEQRRRDALPPPPPEPEAVPAGTPLMVVGVYGPTYPIWDPATSRFKRLKLAPDEDTMNALSLTPDGTAILIGGAVTPGGQRGVFLRGLSSRTPELLVKERPGETVSLVDATYPGGVWAMGSVTDHDQTAVITVYTGIRERLRWSDPNWGLIVDSWQCLQVSPGHDLVACDLIRDTRSLEEKARVVVIDARTGAVAHELENHLLAGQAWHPSGRSLIVTPRRSHHPPHFFEFDLATGDLTPLPEIPPTGKGPERAESEPVCWLTDTELMMRQIRGRKTLLSRMTRDGAFTRITTITADDDDLLDVAPGLINDWARSQAHA